MSTENWNGKDPLQAYKQGLERKESQKRPYNRVTEAMSEVAMELNRARQLVLVLERQYMWLDMLHNQRETIDYPTDTDEECGDGSNYPVIPGD